MVYPNDNWVLQHDLAPCHTAKVVTDFFNTQGVQVLPWPANSPDYSVIKTMWAIVKNKLCSRHITSKNSLLSALLDICVRDGESKTAIFEICKKLIDGMPARIDAVICAKGGHMWY